ncbi:MAG: FkbM family methyltransferase [Flavobacteriia bacterium]|nr:FkbM family methyltransferase [Flavobacteriia bacterium]
MKKVIIKILKTIFDNQFGQRLLQKIHLLVLYLQNYGMSGECDSSGEINVIKKIAKKLSTVNNPTIFDVGANIGKYILFLDKYMINSYNSYCFEPSTLTFKELMKNTSKIQNINLINKGLGDSNETLTLYSNSITNTQSSVLKRDMSHWSEDYNLTNEESVNITTLDNFCFENNIDYIDFLKVDVEGYEIKMFAGSKYFLENKKIGIIQFELGVASVDGKYFFKDVFQLLHENYKIYRITNKNLFEIKNYSEQFEIFLTTNYLAVLKNINL